MPFACSICEQESTRICVFCTKDACAMHICERCGCCSDCCQCDVPLDEPVHEAAPVEPGHEPETAADFPEPSPAFTETLAPAASLDPPPPEASAPAETQPSAPEESGVEPSETPEA